MTKKINVLSCAHELGLQTGIDTWNRFIHIVCSKCGKIFDYPDALFFLEIEFGEISGRKYYDLLRKKQLEVREARKNGEWKSEGIWQPENF